MGMKYKEQGGGSATGLADNFIQFLQQGLQTGSFGSGTATGQAGAANPYGSTTGIAGVLNDVLSGGAGNLGGSLGALLATQQKNDVNSIRSRFGVGGGTAFGTPGQYAESTYRAQAAPQIATQVGGLQMSALNSLLPLLASLSQKGIAQREGAYQPSTMTQVAQVGLPILGAGLGFLAGGPGGAAAGSSIAGSFAPGNGGGGGGFQFNPPTIQQQGQMFMGYPTSNPNQVPQAGQMFGFVPSFGLH